MPLLTIEKIVNGGHGLAKNDDGKVIMVAGALPNETVQAKIRNEKKSYATASISSITEKNPGRIAPACPYIRRCGGCNFQHATAQLQAEIKNDIIAEIIEKDCPKAEGYELFPLLTAPGEFRYRQRIRLHVDEYQRLGFKQKNSHEIVVIEHCLLAPRAINETLAGLAELEAQQLLAEVSSQIEFLWNPEDDTVILIYSLKRKPRPADIQRGKAIAAELPMVSGLFFRGDDFLQQQIAGKSSSPAFSYQITECEKPIRMEWEVGSFCQVNVAQNINMIKKVLEYAEVSSDDKILDLYCGMGNFSIPLAQGAREVIAYEGQGSAIRSGKKNAEANNIKNCSFQKKPVHKACRELLQQKACFDTIIIDPPRQGAPELATDLAALCRKKLVYISCDPATLGRDLNALTRAGFCIKKIQPIDMFPQTYHIENIVLLEKI